MLLRRIARPLLATLFIGDGLSAARNPQSHVEISRAPINKVVTSIGKAPLSDSHLRTIVRVEGVTTIVLGVGLAFGKNPRACGLLLAATSFFHVIATAPVGVSAQTRSERLGLFTQKLGSMGAALLVAADTAGKPSMAYRVTKAKAHRAEERAQE